MHRGSLVKAMHEPCIDPAMTARMLPAAQGSVSCCRRQVLIDGVGNCCWMAVDGDCRATGAQGC